MITEIFNAGFRDLVCVIPPNAKLSSKSNIPSDKLGKIPGRLNASGTWGGYDWLNYQPSYNDAATWQSNGANVGLKAGAFPALDIDCTDEEVASYIEGLALRVLGAAPIRIGRHPKRLLMYRTNIPFGKMSLEFKKNGERQLVEILGDGQQYVIFGKHPSGVDYVIDKDLAELKADGLKPVTLEIMQTFLDECNELLRLLGCDDVVQHGTGKTVDGRNYVDQDGLKGTLEYITEAVHLIPNSNTLFPHRDDYIKFGYALKAALVDHQEEAEELFVEWALKWEGNGKSQNTDANARADWHRMKPPFSIGADYIYDLAKPFGLDIAGVEFSLEEAPADVVQEPKGPAPIQYSDAALARRFINKHSTKVRYCPQWGKWVVFNGRRWAKDEALQVQDWIKEICIAAGAEALANLKGSKAERVATRCASSATMAAVARVACSDRSVVVDPSAFDADIWKINTPTGMIDLKTGMVLPHNPDAMMTKMTAAGADFNHNPNDWLSFLHNSTGGDVELQAYLQRMSGYALTGSTKEHTLIFLYGHGGNGKGTFLNALSHLMGDYATVAPMDTFTASKSDRHATELAGLQGARLVTAQETQEGRQFDEQKVKALTGGDDISARFMRQDFFTYTPQFKLIISGNHRPEIQNLDDAMRRRINMVPFTRKPAVVDRDLPDKLKAEYGAILAWAVKGCMEYLKWGLNPPSVVLEATEEYFDAEDYYKHWLEANCKVGEGLTERTDTLLKDCAAWCRERNIKPPNFKTFTPALETRGFVKYKDVQNRQSCFRGIALKNDFGDLDDLIQQRKVMPFKKAK